MSLVGSLEDLGLGDILQIVSLSRKSGVLRLRCDGGEGRIVLQDGMVLGAAVKGDFEDTKSMLLSGGHLSEEQLDTALAARGGCASVADVVTTAGLIGEEQLETISRSRVEAAVMGMFDWRVGELIFEVRDLVDGSEQAVLLVSPLSTQYIAMEATRKRDEMEHFGGEPFDDDDDGMLFSGEDPSADPIDGLAMGTLESIEALEDDEEIDSNESTQPFAAPPVVLESAQGPFAETASGEISTPVRLAVEPDPMPAQANEPSLAPIPQSAAIPEERVVQVVQEPTERGHLIAIDPDLGALEWLKATVGDLFERVHIFQRAEIGVDRIRHYLGRGVTPMVLLSRLANADRPGGVTELVGRLQALSPAMRVGVMVEQSRELGSGFDAANVIVHRPTSPGSDPAKWIHFEEMAAGVRETLTPLTLVKMTPSAPVEDPAHPTLLRLKRVSDQLRDRSRDSEILNVVLGFASETFSRVAIFMLREASVDAIAQRGLERSGGPSDEQLSMLSFPRDDPPEVFRRVLERRTAIASKLVGPSDERLAMLLGTSAAKQAYVAPIESGGCVAALLYADNQPIGDSIPDTTALEIVLQEAGLALDRALLHRALAEADRALLG